MESKKQEVRYLSDQERSRSRALYEEVFVEDADGFSELYYQITYFIPAISVLCLAASVALRRKGYGIISLISEFIGPAGFVAHLIVCSVHGLL